MNLIDIGVNLMAPSFDRDREDIIRSAAAAGVGPLVITGSSEKSSLEGARFAATYNAKEPRSLYCTAGVHPHGAKDLSTRSLDLFRDLASSELPLVAIGECGLDYNRDYSPREDQRRSLVKQADLASELSLPLFLHERDAFGDFYAIIRNYTKAVPAMVVHCFTGTQEELEHYLGLGCYIGITGWICDERRGKHLKELVKNIPPGRLLLETDSPYLLPRDLPLKVKNKRNEPQFLPHVAQTVAHCLDKDPALLAKETTANARSFFRLPDR
ncbi:MAG: TatD family hydrolase [Treponema sp.]|nr:TatD family hydrolase [Treponema sp.]